MTDRGHAGKLGRHPGRTGHGPPMNRKTLGIALFVLFLVDALVIGAIVAVLGSPGAALMIGVLAFAAPCVLLMGIMPLFSRISGWDTLARRYPPTDDAFAGYRGPVTSIAIHRSWFNFNNCIEINADDDHLHIRMIALIGKWDRAVSIPWEAVREITPARFGRTRLNLIDGPSLWAPNNYTRHELAVRSMPVPDEQHAHAVGETP